MTGKNSLIEQPIKWASLWKKMLIGAGVALALITLFLAGVDDPDPSWPKLWILKPLIIVPIAGAMGGAFYYFVHHVFSERGWNKVVSFLLSVFGYVVAFWLGSVLGLDGTLWN